MIVSACAALAAASSLARAEDSPQIMARMVPGDVDLFLSVSDAGQWRRMALGGPMQAVLRTVLDREDAGASWADFAKQLDLESEEAFDLILGRQVTFIERSSGRTGGSVWAIISTVDRKTERILRRQLKPVPREMRGGKAIMSLEGGRFRLAISSGATQSTLFLGPALAPELFDQITSDQRPRVGRSLADQPHFRTLAQMDQQASALLLARMPDATGGWLGIMAKPTWNSLELDFFIRSPSLAKATTSITPWSRTLALELDHDSFLAAVEWPAADEFELSAFNIIRPFLPAMPVVFTQPGLIDGRRAIVIDASDSALARATLALESRDIRALAKKGDQFIAASFAAMFPGVDAARTLDMQGQFPAATRSVDLSSSMGQVLPAIFDAGPVLSWQYVDRPTTDLQTEPQAGWWAIGSDTAQVNRVTMALGELRKSAEVEAPWVSVGAARPRALLDEIKSRGFAQAVSNRWPFGDILGLVDSVKWSVYRTPEGDLRGQVNLRFVRR